MEKKKTVSFLQSISSSPLPPPPHHPHPPQSSSQPPPTNSHSPHLSDSSNPEMMSSSPLTSSPPSPPPPPPPLLPTNYLQLFPIPTQSKLQNISKIKFYTKISSPGYDMRTIRKHIEQIYSEILTHHNTQGIIYNQNEILWNEIQTLSSLIFSYSNILQKEIKKLNQREEYFFHKKRYFYQEFKNGNEILLENEKLIVKENELKQIILEGKQKEIIALDELQR